MLFLNGVSVETYRNLPISNVAVNKNTVTFVNASGRQRVTLDSTQERIKFIKLLLS
jgi:hypothetical protein